MSAGLEDVADREASILSWLYRQLFVKPPAPPESTQLTDRTAIITGANVGLGFQCSRQLLSLRLSHLVLVVRSEAKGRAAASELQAEFPFAKIDILLLDMESYDSLIQFAQRCQDFPRLDIVILNAGVSKDSFERNPYTKHEATLQINYLSTALLATLLAPILKRKRQGAFSGRLSIVGSDMSHWARFPDPQANSLIQSLDDEENFYKTARYPLTKLMAQLFVASLAERVSPDDVIINLVNPGFCTGTSLGRESSHPWLAKVFAITVGRRTIDGVRAYIDAVIVKSKESHGSYVSDGMIKPYPKVMYTALGREFREKLWKETMAEFEFVKALDIIKEMRPRRD